MEILEQLRKLARENKRLHKRNGEQSDADLPTPSLRSFLDELSKKCGFSGWNHLSHVVQGDSPGDFGTLLCPRRCAAHWNIWSASYDEASEIRAQHGGFLLAYRSQFLIVEADYLRTLGLDPDSSDVAQLGRDWVTPDDKAARGRLYGALIRAQLELN